MAAYSLGLGCRPPSKMPYECPRLPPNGCARKDQSSKGPVFPDDSSRNIVKLREPGSQGRAIEGEASPRNADRHRSEYASAVECSRSELTSYAGTVTSFFKDAKAHSTHDPCRLERGGTVLHTATCAQVAPGRAIQTRGKEASRCPFHSAIASPGRAGCAAWAADPAVCRPEPVRPSGFRNSAALIEFAMW